ncbi:MAG TPA: SRPBCC domain-containing protein, partial [Solirubrobacterales bacterium]|nr:SRPBCC domain-containing protein [Solirubrobacterales bacterium]
LEDMEKVVEMGAVEGMTAAMGQMDPILRGDILVTRALKATPQLVYEAWTTPASFAAWFGGDTIEVPLESVAMDPRPGGAWKATMQLPDGGRIEWVGEYTEVDPPARLAFTISDDTANAATDPGASVTVDIFDAGGPTGMTLIQPRGDFTDEQVARTTAGYNEFLDSMQRLLNRI